jgi:prepilin-type N-terminal cleavage/methylation domain-containing protein
MERPLDLSSPPQQPRQGFTLIEMIGALAVMAILAAALLPALIKHTDKLVADQETATLQALGTALQNNVLRTRSIPPPDNTAWVAVVTNELGMNAALVANNPRNRARVFVVDTNGFSPLSLPYMQTSAGSSVPPAQPRFMLVSSLGAALPGGVVSAPAQAIFNDLWNTAPGAMPSHPIWSGWNNGRGDDLVVQRMTLAPFFVHLILTTNNSTPNYGSYRIDSGPVITNGCNAYFLQGSVLNLYSNAVLDSQQIPQRDCSFVYDQNVWRSSITSSPLVYTNPPDFSSIVDAFVNSGPLSVTPPRIQVVSDFIAYMTNYNNWATGPTPFSVPGKQTVINSYNTMMNDVNALVNGVQPPVPTP